MHSGSDMHLIMHINFVLILIDIISVELNSEMDTWPILLKTVIFREYLVKLIKFYLKIRNKLLFALIFD